MKISRDWYRPDWTLSTDVDFLVSGGKWTTVPEVMHTGAGLRYLDTLSYSIRL